tara:strand:+ start:133 stop:690 length:558 start_codon:yes stop_codon:yes gene_type:complete
MKTCCKCNANKSLNEFYNDKKSKSGKQSYCKECVKEYHLKNRHKVYESIKKYHSSNKDRMRKYARNYVKQRYSTDNLFRTRVALRSRIREAFKSKGWKKNTKTQSVIGADYQTVLNHIESRFKDGMSWNNRGEWHIDHIIPLSSAKTKKELIKLCHYTNLQPLWAKENIVKGSKIIACRVKFKNQ